MWHIYTKDGTEYTGNALKYENDFMVLFRTHRRKTMEDIRDWKWLWLKFKTITYYTDDIESYDYLIPKKNIKYIERLDEKESKNVRFNHR